MSFDPSFLDSLRLGAPRTCSGLTMVPLLGGSADEPPHVTLEEAIAASSAGVSEVSEHGNVPELAFENRGDRPVLLLDGEELLGAKQNRILNLTILVPARARVTIPVSCVERGRWRWSSRRFSSSDSVLFLRARRDKTRDVSESLRASGARFSDQGRVWNHVMGLSRELGSDSATESMHDSYRSADRPLAAFARELGWEPGQCGAAFLVEGCVVGIDLFGHQRTAERLHGKLLRSYALECIARGTADVPAGAPHDAVREFLKGLATAEAGRFDAVGLGEDLRLHGKGLVGAALVHEGTAVHVAAFAA